MRIEFTLTDDSGNRYQGTTELEPAAQPNSSVPAEVSKNGGPQGLPDRIRTLRDAGFFRDPRTPSEVHAKIQETYHCLPDRVQMALLRLQRNRELRKTVTKVGDREQTAYVW